MFTSSIVSFLVFRAIPVLLLMLPLAIFNFKSSIKEGTVEQQHHVNDETSPASW